jgi:hypothetical protein
MANKELTKHKQLECLCTMNYWVNQRTIRYTKIKLFNKVDYRILDFESDIAHNISCKVSGIRTERLHSGRIRY